MGESCMAMLRRSLRRFVRILQTLVREWMEPCLALHSQLFEAFVVEVLLLEQVPLPTLEDPLHEVLVARIARRDHEVGVAADQATSGGEEGDGLHDVPRELPEREPEEEQQFYYDPAKDCP